MLLKIENERDKDRRYQSYVRGSVMDVAIQFTEKWAKIDMHELYASAVTGAY
jgi:hypothetical protein